MFDESKAAYPPGFFSPGTFFFAPPTRSLPVVSNAPQGSPRRKTSSSAGGGSEPAERVLRGGSGADPLSKPHPQRFLSGKVPLVGTRL